MSSSEQLNNIDYKLPKSLKFKVLIGSIFLFVIFLFLYFPLFYQIDKIVKKQLQTLPGCSIQYNEMKTEFFFPKIILDKVSIPGRCFGNRQSKLDLKELKLHFRFFSLSPLGLHFKLETEYLNNPIEAYFTAGFTAIALNIRENTIDAKLLELFVPELKLNGKFKIDTLMEAGSDGIKDLKLNIRSNNLVIPPQKIKGFVLSTLKLNSVLIKAQMENQKLQVKDIILGDNDSPIRANFKGHINVKQKAFKRSTIDLNGEVKFSNKFIEKYSIIKLFMTKFDKKDEFYQISLKGPLTSPKASSGK